MSTVLPTLAGKSPNLFLKTRNEMKDTIIANSFYFIHFEDKMFSLLIPNLIYLILQEGIWGMKSPLS